MRALLFVLLAVPAFAEPPICATLSEKARANLALIAAYENLTEDAVVGNWVNLNVETQLAARAASIRATIGNQMTDAEIMSYLEARYPTPAPTAKGGKK